MINISKSAKKMAKDLELSEADVFIMNVKSTLYVKCSELIKSSSLTHEQIAKKIGTSRSRVNRISNMGENNISIEVLMKLIFVLGGEVTIKSI